MIATASEFRLRPGMRIRLQEGTARVLQVNESSALCELENKQVRTFTTFMGVPVTITAHGKRVRISPNSEVEVLP